MARHRLLCLFALLGLMAASCGRDDPGSTPAPAPGTPTSATDAACEEVELEATDVGVTAETITIHVMADTGSPLAPGLFQGNIDAIEGFAEHVNATGGIGCRQLVVETWDSRLDPTEAKNGLIEACRDSLAMVGNNSLFNPDVSPLTDCPDATGAVTGLPDLAALTADVTEACAPTAFTMQALGERCPIVEGEREITSYLGYWKYLLREFPDARSVYMVPGDLPTTVLASMPILEAQRVAGIDVVDAVKVSGRDEQAAYTPKVQVVRDSGANMVYDGSNDTAMISMRREAATQNLTGVEAWVCTVACYTEAFKAAGSDVDGTYVAMGFLPFEERDQNAELANYLDNVPSPSSWGAAAWQSAVLFQTVIDEIVATEGPNAITRAKILETLEGMDTFDANGWLAPKPVRGVGNCGLVMVIEDGEFRRVHPTEPGTFDCTPEDLVTISIDPAAAAAGLD
jgi:ABC-type branched-subunit amino acid transport system substrate-binding protein